MNKDKQYRILDWCIRFCFLGLALAFVGMAFVSINVVMVGMVVCTVSIGIAVADVPYHE